MVAYQKFESWVGYMLGNPAPTDMHTDLCKVYLTNNLPSATLDLVLADLAEFAGGTGYTAGGEDITNTASETGGTGTVAAVDVVWSVGSSWAAFQYVVACDTSVAGTPLIAWWDYGSALSLVNGESFTVDFAGNSLFTLA